jgi:hypothetical protein
VTAIEQSGKKLDSDLIKLEVNMGKLESSLKTDMAKLEANMGKLESSLKIDMAKLESSLKTDMAKLEANMGKLEASIMKAIDKSDVNQQARATSQSDLFIRLLDRVNSK